MIRFNRNYEFNVPYGHKPQRFAKAYVTKIVNQVAHVSYLICQNSWDFICQSFEDTIAMAKGNSFIYCDPPYIGRHVDYYDSWDEKAELSLHQVLSKSGAKFMVSTWHHNDFRYNHYIQSVWNDCNIYTQDHYYHIGAKEANRNAVVEALLTNYVVTGKQNALLQRNEQLTLFDVPAVNAI